MILDLVHILTRKGGMYMQPFSPEGLYAEPPAAEALHRGLNTGEIFRAMCIKCDEFHNLHVDLGSLRGYIPREEAALGITEGKLREIGILSRVGKPVSFQVLEFSENNTVILSRRAAQLEARSYFLSALRPGDVIPAMVQTAADFGVFCDIGCGFSALMRLDRCCVSRLQSTRDLYRPGQNIFTAVLDVDDVEGRLTLTGRELLGTWEENAALFQTGQTVTGMVRSVMPYGVFVELTPNLSGLAEATEDVQPGDRVSVYLRRILPHRHKIKLNILEKLPPLPPCEPEFQIRQGHLDRWEYYPGSTAVTYF